MSLQNCENCCAGDPDGGEPLPEVPPPAEAPPVDGGAAPPAGVEGFDGAAVVCVGAAAVVVADVVVLVDRFGTDGVPDWPGTVSVGVGGNGFAAFLLPPPQPAASGIKATSAAVASPVRSVIV